MLKRNCCISRHYRFSARGCLFQRRSCVDDFEDRLRCGFGSKDLIEGHGHEEDCPASGAAVHSCAETQIRICRMLNSNVHKNTVRRRNTVVDEIDAEAVTGHVADVHERLHERKRDRVVYRSLGKCDVGLVICSRLLLTLIRSERTSASFLVYFPRK